MFHWYELLEVQLINLRAFINLSRIQLILRLLEYRDAFRLESAGTFWIIVNL